MKSGALIFAGLLVFACGKSKSDKKVEPAATEKAKAKTEQGQGEKPKPTTTTTTTTPKEVSAKGKFTPEGLTEKLNQLKTALDMDGLFAVSSKAYRATIEKQAKAMVEAVPEKAFKAELKLTKQEARKLSALELLKRLVKLPTYRKALADAPHKFLKVVYKDKKTAIVTSKQKGLLCTRQFVVEDGDWKVDKGAKCEDPKPTAADAEFFPKLVAFSRTLLKVAVKNKGNCDKIAVGWRRVMLANPALVKKRKQLFRDRERYRVFAVRHKQQNVKLAQALLPILQKCARNKKLRNVLTSMM